MWSLSVEEHFYLIWPLLGAAFLFRMRSRYRVILLGLSIIIAAALRTNAYRRSGPLVLEDGLLTIDAYRSTPFRIGAILMGCLLAIIFFRRQFRGISTHYESACLILSLVLLGLVAVFLEEENRLWKREVSWEPTSYVRWPRKGRRNAFSLIPRCVGWDVALMGSMSIISPSFLLLSHFEESTISSIS